MHALALACMSFVSLTWYWFAVAIPAVLVYSIWSFLRLPKFVSLRLTIAEGVSCLEADGTSVYATVLPESTVFGWLVVLRFRIDGDSKVRALTLLPDHMSCEEFRMLRLWLRWNTTNTTVVKSAGGAS